jgi:hypothetical protein
MVGDHVRAKGRVLKNAPARGALAQTARRGRTGFRIIPEGGQARCDPGDLTGPQNRYLQLLNRRRADPVQHNGTIFVFALLKCRFIQ